MEIKYKHIEGYCKLLPHNNIIHTNYLNSNNLNDPWFVKNLPTKPRPIFEITLDTFCQGRKSPRAIKKNITLKNLLKNC